MKYVIVCIDAQVPARAHDDLESATQAAIKTIQKNNAGRFAGQRVAYRYAIAKVERIVGPKNPVIDVEIVDEPAEIFYAED